MMYQIKLEDRENNREVMIECPANMILEELNIKIKSEFHLPCNDERGHYFQFNGKVYLPNDAVFWNIWGDSYMYVTDIQSLINYPSGRSIRSSRQCRLSQVFTVKGSVVVFQQIYRSKQVCGSKQLMVYCTLIDRV